MSKGSAPRPYSVSQDKFLANWDAIFNKEKNMVMQTSVANKNEIGKCGCGRSPSGLCVGWHSLTEEEYQVRLAQYTQESVEQKDSPLTESGQTGNQ
jgi:hypothetical protein